MRCSPLLRVPLLLVVLYVIPCVPLIAIDSLENRIIYGALLIPIAALVGTAVFVFSVTMPLRDLTGHLRTLLQDFDVAFNAVRRGAELFSPTETELDMRSASEDMHSVGHVRSGSFSEAITDPERPSSAVTVAGALTAMVSSWTHLCEGMRVSSSDADLFALQGGAKDVCEHFYGLLVHQVLQDAGEDPADYNLSSREHALLRRIRSHASDGLAPTQERLRQLDASTIGIGDPLPASTGGPTPTRAMEVPFFMRRGNRFPGDDSTICFYIARSKDSYIVAYRCRMEAVVPDGVVVGEDAVDALRGDGAAPPLLFDGNRKIKPLEAQWYADRLGGQADAAAAAEGGAGLSYWERRSGLDVVQSPLALAAPAAIEGAPIDATVQRATRVSLKFPVLGQRLATLCMARCHVADSLSGEGIRYAGGAWAPVVVGTVNGVTCILESAFLHLSDPGRFWRIPRVQSADLYGLSLEDNGTTIRLGMRLVERIVL